MRSSRHWLAMTSGALGFFVLVAVLYAAAHHAFAGDSDGATVVLQGQSMGSGNLTLHGWALSLDSFWTIDAVVYTLVELVSGVRGMLLYLVPALIAAAVILVGVFLARDGRRGVSAVAAGVTVVVLLGLPNHELANVFLRGPLHVGTALLCLVAFAGLRSGRLGWGWVAGVLCLAAGVLGDFQTAVLGVGSVFAAGLVAALRTRAWRAGIPELSASAAALVVAALVRAVSEAVGTFSVNSSHPVASWSRIVTNLRHLPSLAANLLGVGKGQLGTGGTPAALQLVHVIGVVVVAGGLIAGIVAMVRGVIRGGTSSQKPTAAWRLEDLLVLAVLADLVVFLALTTSDDPGFLRYLTAAVIFGTVLGARWVGRLVAAVPSSRFARRGALAVGLIAVAALTAGFGFTLSARVPRQQSSQLDRFLEARQLDVGVGDYWSASITTVSTNGEVIVRPVIATPHGRVVRYQRQSEKAWYTDQPFQFLVYNTAKRWGGVDATSASLTFGPAARTYTVGPYRVLVWSHPLSVSAKGWPID